MNKLFKVSVLTLGFLVATIGLTSWANSIAEKLQTEAPASKSGGPLDVNFLKPAKPVVGKKAKYRAEIRITEKADAISFQVRAMDKDVRVYKTGMPMMKKGPFGVGSQTSFDFQLGSKTPGLKSVAVDVTLLQDGKESSRSFEIKANFSKEK